MKVESESDIAREKARLIMSLKPSCCECGEPAEHTLDFDIIGDLTQIPVCKRCTASLEEKITAELIFQERLVSFGLDGRGRA